MEGGNANHLKEETTTLKSESEAAAKRKRVDIASSVSPVNTAVLVIVMSQVAVLEMATSRVGVKRQFEHLRSVDMAEA